MSTETARDAAEKPGIAAVNAALAEMKDQSDWIPGHDRPSEYGYHVQKAITAALAEKEAMMDRAREELVELRNEIRSVLEIAANDDPEGTDRVDAWAKRLVAQRDAAQAELARLRAAIAFHEGPTGFNDSDPLTRAEVSAIREQEYAAHESTKAELARVREELKEARFCLSAAGISISAITGERNSLAAEVEVARSSASRYFENLSSILESLSFLDTGDGANTAVALALKAKAEVERLRGERSLAVANLGYADEKIAELQDFIKKHTR